MSVWYNEKEHYQRKEDARPKSFLVFPRSGSSQRSMRKSLERISRNGWAAYITAMYCR